MLTGEQPYSSNVCFPTWYTSRTSAPCGSSSEPQADMTRPSKPDSASPSGPNMYVPQTRPCSGDVSSRIGNRVWFVTVKNTCRVAPLPMRQLGVERNAVGFHLRQQAVSAGHGGDAQTPPRRRFGRG